MEECVQWDPLFFEEFAKTGNLLSQSLGPLSQYRLTERPDDFKKLLEPSREFAKNHVFLALIAKREGKPVGRILLTFRVRESRGEAVAAGWFDSENNVEVAQALFERAQNWAAQIGVNEIRTPIQGSFFHGYRMLLRRITSTGPVSSVSTQGQKPFFGEPLHPPHHAALMQACGFQSSGLWHTVQISVKQSWEQFSSIFRKFFEQQGSLGNRRLKAAAGAPLRVRKVDLTHWESELLQLHTLLSESYRKMPEFEPIPAAEFVEAYRDFRLLIHRHLFFFLENQDHNPAAFVVSFMDPLPSLRLIDRAKDWSFWGSKVIRPIACLWALFRLRYPYFRRMLVVYIGKVERPDLSVKGVTGLLGYQLTWNALIHLCPGALICYLAEDSPTYRSLPPHLPRISEYGMFRKSWSSTEATVPNSGAHR